MVQCKCFFWHQTKTCLLENFSSEKGFRLFFRLAEKGFRTHFIFIINWVEVDKISYFFKSSKGRSRKSFVKTSHENIHESRGVFRTQSNIYGGAFCGSIERLLAVNYFQKSSIIDVHPGSKSNSGICPTLISKNYEPLSIISLRNISSSSYWDSLQ